MLILVGFAQQIELWQQVMPISLPTATNSAMPGYGRHEPRLLGRVILRFLQLIMAIARPTKQVRSRYKSTDLDAV